MGNLVGIRREDKASLGLPNFARSTCERASARLQTLAVNRPSRLQREQRISIFRRYIHQEFSVSTNFILFGRLGSQADINDNDVEVRSEMSMANSRETRKGTGPDLTR
jgi:hypothetical protein